VLGHTPIARKAIPPRPVGWRFAGQVQPPREPWPEAQWH